MTIRGSEQERRGSAARHAALILVVALAVRAAIPLAAPGMVRDSWDTKHRYAALAHSLLDGDGFVLHGRPSAISGPVYPLLLAGVYGTLGESPWAVRSILSLLDAGTCLLAFLIARRLAGPRTALLAGLGLAAAPYLPYPILLAASDTVFVTFVTAGLLAVVTAHEHDGAPWAAAAAGLLLGLAALTRATALLLPIPLALGLALLVRPRRRAVTAAALLLAAFVAAIAPWTIRNAVHFHRFVPIQTLGGYHLLMAATSPEDARRTGADAEPGRVAERDVELYDRAVRDIVADPATFAGRMARRLKVMWFQTHSGRWNAFLAAANAALLLLATAGAVALRHRWRLLAPLLLTFAYFVAVHTVFFAIFRYMLPVVPILAVLAAVPVAALLAPRGRGATSRPAPAPPADAATVAAVVPAGPGCADGLGRCLAALAAGEPAPDDVLVVADGADPAVVAAAEHAGARVLTNPRALGPAAARNRGVEAVSSEIVLFLDADVVPPPDVVARVRAGLADAGVDAVFGSYDDRPADRHPVSTYRNLLHHWVHQQAREEASTFWSGCGAVRREALLAAGGFRTDYDRPSIEDIELGLRLRGRGHRIRVLKELQVTHLKRWTVTEMVRTDVLARAAPWTELLLERGAWVDDLNLRHGARASLAAAAVVALGLAASPLAPSWGAGAAAAAGAVFVGLNGGFLGFLARRRGAAFAIVAVPLHLLHTWSAGAGFGLGLARHLRRRRTERSAAAVGERP